MKFHCVICTESFSAASTISVLPCGHCFHKNCIQRWFLQAKTCPQCRSSVVKSKVIHQLFVSSNPDDSIVETDSTESIESLEMELIEKGTQINKYIKDITLKKNKIIKLEEKLSEKVSDFQIEKVKNKTLHQELHKFHNEKKNYESATNEMKKMEKYLSQLKSVANIIESSKEEISSYSFNEGRDELVIMCGVLKRELASKRSQNKTLNAAMHALRVSSNNEVKRQSTAFDKMGEENETLKLNLNSCETEISGLRKKLTVLQNSMITPKHPSGNKRLMNESPIPISFTPDLPKKIKSPISSDSDEENQNIRINKKSKLKVNSKMPLKFNVLKHKKNFGSLMDTCQRNGYNGFGGHSKHINIKK